MPDLYDKTVETVELMPPDDRVIHVEETVRESSEDETRSTTIKSKKSPVLFCRHYGPYGYSCFCGNRFCRSCLEQGRIWYCEVCNVTIGPCHFKKREDGVFCPEHMPSIDWKGSWGQLIIGGLLLGGLFMAVWLLFRLVH